MPVMRPTNDERIAALEAQVQVLQAWQNAHHEEARRLSLIGAGLTLCAGFAAGLFWAGVC